MMRKLIEDLIPHAPQVGLFVGAEIPSDRLSNAIGSYAPDVPPGAVVALYDATLLGNGKDGALFLPDRVVFRNHALKGANSVRYQDVVHVEERRRLLGGRRVQLKVNRGRATFRLAMDFSGRPDAAPYVARFISEAMLREDHESTDDRMERVASALQTLVRQKLLSPEEADRMLSAIR